MQLYIIRHGESLANCARQKAESENAREICFDGREMDVALSEKGRHQSEKLRLFFKDAGIKPDVIFSSPYERTKETAHILIDNSDIAAKTIFDERLRERELGIFDRLTKTGAMEKYPDECKKREEIGKFYYRPIGGESWADVALRIRDFYRDLRDWHPDQAIFLITHEVVIRVLRYLIEEMSESQILEIDKKSDVENGAITLYQFENGKAALKLDNFLPE